MALIFNERLEANPGYDETSAGAGGNWSEYNSGGGTLDKDFAVSSVESLTGLSLPSWGSQCLKLAGGTAEVRDSQSLDVAYADLYIRFDVIINDATGLPNNTDKSIFYSWDGSFADAMGFLLRRYSDGNLYLRFSTNASPSFPAWPGYGPISLDTKYRIDMHFVGSGTCEGKINGVSQGTGSTTTANLKIFSFYKPSPAASADGTVFYDNIQLSTDGWVPDDSSLVELDFSGVASASEVADLALTRIQNIAITNAESAAQVAAIALQAIRKISMADVISNPQIETTILNFVWTLSPLMDAISLSEIKTLALQAIRGLSITGISSRSSVGPGIVALSLGEVLNTRAMYASAYRGADPAVGWRANVVIADRRARLVE